MAKVLVDGKAVTVPDSANALEACRAAGVEVPHFCYHPRLPIVGQCRMCMVEIEGVPKIQASCTVPVRDGMVIRASTEKALAARNATMEFLLINHPLDCPICDQAGECKLQDNAFGAGLPVSRTSEPRRLIPGYDRTDIGPHVIADMTRCIQCTRCVRFCEEIAGTGELTFVERGGHTFVWTHEGKALDNEWSACAADVCPVGALTTKEFRFRKRVWWLEKTRSICTGCEIGCNISIEHRDGLVQRFLPRVNPEVNDFWMCDYGRFRSEDLNARDYTRPVLREGEARRETNWGEALDAIKTAVDAVLTKDGPASILVLGSANLSTEESFLLRSLFGERLGVEALELVVEAGPERRIRNPKARDAEGGSPLDGFLRGREAAPNSRGAKLAGFVPEGPDARLRAAISGSFSPSVVYVSDAEFSSRAGDAGFVDALRRAAGFLIVHARKRNLLSEAADIVLPVAALSGKEGTFVNAQGRIQRFDLAILPPPIVRSDLDVLLHLGRRWDVFDTKWTARDVFAQLGAHFAPYEGILYDSRDLVGYPPSVSPAAAYDALLLGSQGVDDTQTLEIAKP